MYYKDGILERGNAWKNHARTSQAPLQEKKNKIQEKTKLIYYH